MKLAGKSTRIGLYKCREKGCRKPFRVTVGTVFEDSHIKLNVWLQAIYLVASSKKGISSNQLHRSLGISLKAAWFMSHRIREAMKALHMEPMGECGQHVEVDETFIGRDYDVKPRGDLRGRGYGHKYKFVSLVDRMKGEARSIVVDDLSMRTLMPLLRENVHPHARLMTDEAAQYQRLGHMFASHQ